MVILLVVLLLILPTTLSNFILYEHIYSTNRCWVRGADGLKRIATIRGV